MLVEHALEMVLLQIGRRLTALRTDKIAPRGGLARWQLRRVTEYMHDRCGEPVTLEELASLVGLSRFHLCSAVHRSMGMPPHKWLRKIRMEQAKRLLLDTQMSIVEVALHVGYDSPSAFAKAFKSVAGVAPAFFRRAS
jgi:AraC family transcriptional regulator